MNNFGKTIIAVSMSAAMALSFAACSSNTNDASSTDATEETTAAVVSGATVAADLANSGYDLYSFSCSDGEARVLAKNGTDFVLIKCAMTDEQAGEYMNIEDPELTEEENNLREAEYLDSLGGVTAENVNDKIPTDLDKYTGKTMGDLENEGYEQAGVYTDEDGNNYIEFDSDEYIVYAYPEDTSIDLMDVVENGYTDIVIGKVTFADFGDIDLI